MARQGKALNRRLKRRAKAEAKHTEELAAREAKQIVKTDAGARPVSAETRKVTESNPQIVPGGLPGHGKGN
jgi:hypothetical protein